MIKYMPQPVRRPVFLLVVCFAILAFALAACGGDSGSAASTSSSSSASSGSGAAQTVNVKEQKGANSSSDVYTCDPTTLSVKKGDSVTFTNQTDEVQDFSAGDASKAGVTIKLDLNQSGTATFNTAGTFNLKSTKGAAIAVTVQ